MKNILKFILPPLIGALVSLVVLAASAVIICYTPADRAAYNTAVICARVSGAMISGFLSAKGAPSRGWLRGGIAGAVYAVLLCVFSGFENSPDLIYEIPKAFGLGAAGGVIGINMKK